MRFTQTHKNSICLLFSIIGFMLLIFNAYILKLVEPIGYHYNIYSMLPLSFYSALILCYFIGSFLVLAGKKKIGVLILCLNHFAILIIPYMLGYYSMGRADDMSYIGEYLQITNSGYVLQSNIYPAAPIIGATISIISDVGANITSFIIPIMFSFVFIIGMYMFSRYLFTNSCIRSLAITSSFILYLGTYNFLNVPHALFYAYMPLFLYVMHSHMENKNKNFFNFSIIFVLIIWLIPFTHPFIVYFVLFYVLILLTYKWLLFSRINKIKIPNIKFNALILLFISYLSWFLYQGRLLNVLVRDINRYINEMGRGPVVDRTADKIVSIQFDFFDYLQLISVFYGRYIFPTIFIIGFFVYLYYFKKKRQITIPGKWKLLCLLYFIFMSIQFLLLFNPLITHQPDRLMNLNFVIYAQIPLFSLSVYILFLQKSKSSSRILMVCIILTLIWSFSFFGAFDSPNVYRTNVALTNNEIKGMNWFLESKAEYPIGMVSEQPHRYIDIFGLRGKHSWDRIIIPDHFGYDSSINTFDEIYFFDKFSDLDFGYLAITTLGELLYQEVPGYNKIARFTEDDFCKLRNDVSVHKIYHSLNIEINLVEKESVKFKNITNESIEAVIFKNTSLSID